MKQSTKRKRRQDAARAHNLPKRRALINDRYCAHCQFKYRCHNDDGRRLFRCPPYQTLKDYGPAVDLIETLADLEGVATDGWNMVDINTKPRVSGRTTLESRPPKYDEAAAGYYRATVLAVVALTKDARSFLSKRQIKLFGCNPGPAECPACGWYKYREGVCRLERLK